MRILSTLTVLLYSSILAGQHVLPEVVLVTDAGKIPTRESRMLEIRLAATTNLVFPLKKNPQKIIYGGCGCFALNDRQPEVKPVKVKLRCWQRERPAAPLLVIDGLIQERRVLATIDPDHIESIEVLKGAAATVIYGFSASEGVIIITTKKVKMRYDTLTIRDITDKSSIPKATISFVFPVRNDTLRYIADDSGVVVSNSLPRLDGCEMIVSAVGYKTMSRSFTGPANVTELFLERDIKACPEVVISCFDCIRWIRCGSSSRVVRAKAEGTPVTVSNKLKVFPNPAKAGQRITIQQEFAEEEIVQARIIHENGSLLSTQSTRVVKGMNRISLATGANWSAGPCFIQLFYANGRLAASQLVIIQ